MLNKCFFQGRFVRDPELRRTQSGTAVASFTLAVERDFKESDGTRKADFIDFVAWRGTAEFICRNFSKGRMAIVAGPMQIRPWEDKDGNKRRSYEVTANEVYFSDSKRDAAEQSESNGYAPSSAYPTTADTSAQEFSELSEEDGELPFK